MPSSLPRPSRPSLLARATAIEALRSRVAERQQQQAADAALAQAAQQTEEQGGPAEDGL